MPRFSGISLVIIYHYANKITVQLYWLKAEILDRTVAFEPTVTVYGSPYGQ